jgi:hypothetical protein
VKEQQGAVLFFVVERADVAWRVECCCTLCDGKVDCTLTPDAVRGVIAELRAAERLASITVAGVEAEAEVDI